MIVYHLDIHAHFPVIMYMHARWVSSHQPSGSMTRICSGPTANVGTDKSCITAVLSLARCAPFRLTRTVTSAWPVLGLVSEMKQTAQPTAWPIFHACASADGALLGTIKRCRKLLAFSQPSSIWIAKYVITYRDMVAELI